MSRRRHSYSQNNSFSKNIKDYIVPIIGFILILFLVYFCFKKDGTQNKVTENQVGISITKEIDSSATIFYLNGGKAELTEGMQLFKSERILVSTGRVKVENDNVSFNLNKLGELKYGEDGNFTISSGEVWIDAKNDIVVDMKFAKLKISKDSHLSVGQNEVLSSINVVSGTVEVLNSKGRSTVVSGGERIDMKREYYSDEKIDLSLSKQPLDDIFLKGDWFVINKGNDYLNSNKSEETNTGNTSTGSTSTGKSEEKTNESNITGKSKYLTFSNLSDESNVSSSIITILGVYDIEEVSKIEVNGVLATLNSEKGTFKIDGVSTLGKTNDLVFKVFDGDEYLKEKFVYTVYNDSGSDSTSVTNTSSNSDSTTNVFTVDGTKFVFTAPSSSGTYTTTEDFVTIRGSILAPNIDKVTVNNSKLNSFNGKTWRYHAAFQFETLKNGTNLYEVRYYSGGNMVYKNTFTIIKKDSVSGTTIKNTNSDTVSTEEVNLESNSSSPLAY